MSKTPPLSLLFMPVGFILSISLVVQIKLHFLQSPKFILFFCFSFNKLSSIVCFCIECALFSYHVTNVLCVTAVTDWSSGGRGGQRSLCGQWERKKLTSSRKRSSCL